MHDETSLISATEIRWVASHSANCFHTANAMRRGQATALPELCKILDEPVQLLQQTIETFDLNEEAFWEHLVPLSASIENNTQLIKQVFRKAVGTSPRVDSMVAQLAGRVADVEAAVRRTMPELLDDLAAQVDTFAAQWNESGPALLHAVGRLTDPRFIVSRADVILVPAVCGGAGVAHLPYNSTRIEAVETDPVAELPEILRLAWLLAQLNVDLPIFTETVPRDHLALLAAVAMLPALLDAATELHLAHNDPATLRLTMDTWRINSPIGLNLADTVSTWWQSHLDLRPAWNVSLAALDRMIWQEA